MKVTLEKGQCMLTELTPFQQKTLLRCISAVAHHLRNVGCDEEQLYNVSDTITELSFSQDEVDVLSDFLRSYPDLEKRACYAPDSERQKPYSHQQEQSLINPTYRVVVRTIPGMEGSYPLSDGHTEEVLNGILTLSEAYDELLYWYNEKFCHELPYAPTWDVAVQQSKGLAHRAFPTSPDGTRRFCYYGSIFSIEEEE